MEPLDNSVRKDSRVEDFWRAFCAGTRLPADTPIIVSLHHPPYSSEFANPTEMDTFLDLLRDYNVVLMLYGHGHNVEQRDVGGIPGIMGCGI